MTIMAIRIHANPFVAILWPAECYNPTTHIIDPVYIDANQLAQEHMRPNANISKHWMLIKVRNPFEKKKLDKYRNILQMHENRKRIRKANSLISQRIYIII